MDDLRSISLPESTSEPQPPPYPVAEGFRGSAQPTDADLRAARWVDLSRVPASDQAKALAARVADIVAERRDRKRPLGPAGRETLRRHAGVLLAGVLRAAYRGHVVSAHRSPKGGVWSGSVIGQAAAWGILDAMERAGLMGVRDGVQINQWAGDDPIFGGLPTRVWPMPVLIGLAAHHGVTAETLATDWITNPEVECRAVTLKRDDLVTIRSLERGNPRGSVRRDQAAEVEAMRDRLAELNSHVRTVPITGCPPPAFRRIFLTDLRLHGRFYASGGSNYQNAPKEDRGLIRIGGEAVTEVDLHAAFLTLLLGLSGVREMSADDLYAAIGLPRVATKAWMVQTFATGRPATRWGREAPAEVNALGIRATTVRDAALRTYPALADLRRIVPADLLRRLPEDRHGWAVGQYLTNLESRVMDAALSCVKAHDVVGLPMHDSIIVPASGAIIAADALRGACWAVARIEPRVKVSG